MREIRFRAWDRLNNKFRVFEKILYGVDGNPIAVQFEGDEDITGMDFVNLVEYTGLTDSRGRDVYDGDLFGKMGGDVERPNEYEIHAKVYFDEDLAAFCIDDQRGGWEYLSDYLNKQKNEREIIGNIYENPELL